MPGWSCAWARSLNVVYNDKAVSVPYLSYCIVGHCSPLMYAIENERYHVFVQCRTIQAFPFQNSWDSVTRIPKTMLGKPTTVMGIFGAFGKTNSTSSNFPRLLKFCAMGILQGIRPGIGHHRECMNGMQA